MHGRYCYPGPIVSALTPPAYQVISRLYQSDDAALQALRQNSQILLPVYSSPTLLQVRNPVQHGLQPYVVTACAPMSTRRPRSCRTRTTGCLLPWVQPAALTWGCSLEYDVGCRPQGIGTQARITLRCAAGCSGGGGWVGMVSSLAAWA